MGFIRMPTKCGYCGSPLVEGDDGMLHCSLMCPNWRDTVEAGIEPDEAFAEWKDVYVESCVENENPSKTKESAKQETGKVLREIIEHMKNRQLP